MEAHDVEAAHRGTRDFAELKPPGYWDGERFVEVRMVEPGTYEEAKTMLGGAPDWDDEWEDDWDFTTDPPTRRTD